MLAVGGLNSLFLLFVLPTSHRLWPFFLAVFLSFFGLMFLLVLVVVLVDVVGMATQRLLSSSSVLLMGGEE